MSFLRKIFKRKKKKEKIIPKAEVREDVPLVQEKKPSAHGRPAAPLVKGVLLHTRVTEKSNNAVKENKYTFTVADRTNKVEIVRAVKAHYGVDVEAVRVIAGRDKMRRRGRQIGWKRGFKKAIVTVREGQTIKIS